MSHYVTNKIRPQGPLQLASPLWRFDKHEISSGYLAPAAGAALKQYDPGQEYDMLKRWTIKPPYTTLLNLARGLRSSGPDVSPDDARLILDFCNRYGLPGILPGTTSYIRLPPRCLYGEARGQTGLIAKQVVYRQINGTWYEDYGSPESLRLEDVTALGLTEGAVIPDEAARRYGFLPPGRSFFDLDDLRWKVEALNQGYCKYFPSIPQQDAENFAYPMPTSNRFWEIYAEPVDQFIAFVRAFRENAEAISEYDPATWQVVNPHPKRGPEGTVTWANHFMDSLANFVERKREKAHGKRRVLLSPSLIGVMAEMFSIDIDENRRIYYCATCGDAFASDGDRVRYCSARCRNTMQRRINRQNAASKKEAQ
jgi:hypothetical protein